MQNYEKNILKKITEKSIEKSADSICFFLLHQPKAPTKLSEYAKKK
ncbi:MAG: cyclic lactone autoinducer peptide [Lachnospiraceae bacterium]|nr:cyclic lactone autoinducer peptide [Lachnospiraceae bacterium]